MSTSPEEPTAPQLSLDELQAIIPSLRHFIVTHYDGDDNLIEASVMAHALNFSPSGALLFSVHEVTPAGDNIQTLVREGFGEWKHFHEVLAPSRMPSAPRGVIVH
jgi:hypothetical protein